MADSETGRVGHFLCAPWCVRSHRGYRLLQGGLTETAGQSVVTQAKLFSLKVCNKFVKPPRVFRTQATTTTVGVHSYRSSRKPVNFSRVAASLSCAGRTATPFPASGYPANAGFVSYSIEIPLIFPSRNRCDRGTDAEPCCRMATGMWHQSDTPNGSSSIPQIVKCHKPRLD